MGDTIKLFKDHGIEVFSFGEDDTIQRHDFVEVVDGPDYVIAMFKKNKMERVRLNGGISREVAVEHDEVKKRFIASFGNDPPMKSLVDKFLESFGTIDRTTKSKDGYYQMVGKFPNGNLDKPKFNFRGYFGWRWKVEQGIVQLEKAPENICS